MRGSTLPDHHSSSQNRMCFRIIQRSSFPAFLVQEVWAGAPGICTSIKFFGDAAGAENYQAVAHCGGGSAGGGGGGEGDQDTRLLGPLRERMRDVSEHSADNRGKKELSN